MEAFKEGVSSEDEFNRYYTFSERKHNFPGSYDEISRSKVQYANNKETTSSSLSIRPQTIFVSTFQEKEAENENYLPTDKETGMNEIPRISLASSPPSKRKKRKMATVSPRNKFLGYFQYKKGLPGNRRGTLSPHRRSSSSSLKDIPSPSKPTFMSHSLQNPLQASMPATRTYTEVGALRVGENSFAKLPKVKFKDGRQKKASQSANPALAREDHPLAHRHHSDTNVALGDSENSLWYSKEEGYLLNTKENREIIDEREMIERGNSKEELSAAEIPSFENMKAMREYQGENKHTPEGIRLTRLLQDLSRFKKEQTNAFGLEDLSLYSEDLKRYETAKLFQGRPQKNKETGSSYLPFIPSFNGTRSQEAQANEMLEKGYQQSKKDIINITASFSDPPHILGANKQSLFDPDKKIYIRKLRDKLFLQEASKSFVDEVNYPLNSGQHLFKMNPNKTLRDSPGLSREEATSSTWAVTYKPLASLHSVPPRNIKEYVSKGTSTYYDNAFLYYKTDALPIKNFGPDLYNVEATKYSYLYERELARKNTEPLHGFRREQVIVLDEAIETEKSSSSHTQTKPYSSEGLQAPSGPLQRKHGGKRDSAKAEAVLPPAPDRQRAEQFALEAFRQDNKDFSSSWDVESGKFTFPSHENAPGEVDGRVISRKSNLQKKESSANPYSFMSEVPKLVNLPYTLSAEYIEETHFENYIQNFTEYLAKFIQLTLQSKDHYYQKNKFPGEELQKILVGEEKMINKTPQSLSKEFKRKPKRNAENLKKRGELKNPVDNEKPVKNYICENGYDAIARNFQRDLVFDCTIRAGNCTCNCDEEGIAEGMYETLLLPKLLEESYKKVEKLICDQKIAEDAKRSPREVEKEEEKVPQDLKTQEMHPKSCWYSTSGAKSENIKLCNHHWDRNSRHEVNRSDYATNALTNRATSKPCQPDASLELPPCKVDNFKPDHSCKLTQRFSKDGGLEENYHYNNVELIQRYIAKISRLCGLECSVPKGLERFVINLMRKQLLTNEKELVSTKPMTQPKAATIARGELEPKQETRWKNVINGILPRLVLNDKIWVECNCWSLAGKSGQAAQKIKQVPQNAAPEKSEENSNLSASEIEYPISTKGPYRKEETLETTTLPISQGNDIYKIGHENCIKHVLTCEKILDRCNLTCTKRLKTDSRNLTPLPKGGQLKPSLMFLTASRPKIFWKGKDTDPLVDINTPTTVRKHGPYASRGALPIFHGQGVLHPPHKFLLKSVDQNFSPSQQSKEKCEIEGGANKNFNYAPFYESKTFNKIHPYDYIKYYRTLEMGAKRAFSPLHYNTNGSKETLPSLNYTDSLHDSRHAQGYKRNEGLSQYIPIRKDYPSKTLMPQIPSETKQSLEDVPNLKHQDSIDNSHQNQGYKIYGGETKEITGSESSQNTLTRKDNYSKFFEHEYALYAKNKASFNYIPPVIESTSEIGVPNMEGSSLEMTLTSLGTTGSEQEEEIQNYIINENLSKTLTARVAEASESRENSRNDPSLEYSHAFETGQRPSESYEKVHQKTGTEFTSDPNNKEEFEPISISLTPNSQKSSRDENSACSGVRLSKDSPPPSLSDEFPSSQDSLTS